MGYAPICLSPSNGDSWRDAPKWATCSTTTDAGNSRHDLLVAPLQLPLRPLIGKLWKAQQEATLQFCCHLSFRCILKRGEIGLGWIFIRIQQSVARKRIRKSSHLHLQWETTFVKALFTQSGSRLNKASISFCPLPLYFSWWRIASFTLEDLPTLNLCDNMTYVWMYTSTTWHLCTLVTC